MLDVSALPVLSTEAASNFSPEALTTLFWSFITKVPSLVYTFCNPSLESKGKNPLPEIAMSNVFEDTLTLP